MVTKSKRVGAKYMKLLIIKQSTQYPILTDSASDLTNTSLNTTTYYVWDTPWYSDTDGTDSPIEWTVWYKTPYTVAFRCLRTNAGDLS